MAIQPHPVSESYTTCSSGSIRPVRKLLDVVDVVVKKKISSPRRESNPRTPIVQRYTTELSRSLYINVWHRKAVVSTA